MSEVLRYERNDSLELEHTTVERKDARGEVGGCIEFTVTTYPKIQKEGSFEPVAFESIDEIGITVWDDGRIEGHQLMGRYNGIEGHDYQSAVLQDAELAKELRNFYGALRGKHETAIFQGLEGGQLSTKGAKIVREIVSETLAKCFTPELTSGFQASPVGAWVAEISAKPSSQRGR